MNLSISGHGLNKSVEQVVVAAKDDIIFAENRYGYDWGITKSPENLTPIFTQLFKADTQYYLWVTFCAKEGRTLEELTKENVFLDGKAALSLTDARAL